MSANQKRKFFWPVLGMVIMTSLAIFLASTRSGRGAFSNPPRVNLQRASIEVRTSSSSLAEPNAVASMPVTADDDKGFWLTVRPKGFEIKELTITAGEYFVVIQNATGLDELAFRIERATGEQVQEVRFSRFKKHWKHAMRFSSGTYRIFDVEHPEWTCRIAVK